ncbi:CD276 antigen-like isoform X2 [Scleropages formosus]|uniref:CD276 antigen-like isoform X2 n=1 Tax=Scleropages formosus TaxID=113540 RepID=UPI0008783CBC|nr:CD276 antigen-like isoform X2 [Scleropages formosus]
MVGTQVWLYTLLGISVLVEAKKNPEVHVTTCLISGNCVLPCRFQPSARDIISWYRQEVLLLSSSNHSSQLQHGERVSLFEEKVASGNASLLLNHCTFQDRGKYRCHVNSTVTNQESFVLLRVEAPMQFLSLKIAQPEIQQLNCSSQGIYPAPHLQWSTEPPLPLQALRPITRMAADRSGLYSVRSSLTMVGSSANYTYICTVNASYGTQTWKASLRKKDMTGTVGQALTIPCFAPRDMTNFTLTWTFMRDQQPSTILTYSSGTKEMNNDWSHQARVDKTQARSGNGSLRLWNLMNQENAGTYTCTFSATQSTHTVLTSISIISTAKATSYARIWIITLVVIALFLLGIALLVYAKQKGVFYSWRLMSEPADHSEAGGTTQMQTMETEQATASADPDNSQP